MVKKVSELSALTASPASGDELLIRDVSEAAADESKKITADDFMFGDATTPTTQAFGDSAATGSAIEASRVDHKHGMPTATKEFTVLIAGEAAGFAYTTGMGDYQTATITSTQNVNFMFKVPADFVSLTSCVVVLIADATETVQWDVTATFAATGQAKGTHSDSITNATESTTLDAFFEAPVTDALTSIAAGDHVGLQFESDTSDLQPCYLVFTYTV